MLRNRGVDRVEGQGVDFYIEVSPDRIGGKYHQVPIALQAFKRIPH